jgi:hypothetical protein
MMTGGIILVRCHVLYAGGPQRGDDEGDDQDSEA